MAPALRTCSCCCLVAALLAMADSAEAGSGFLKHVNRDLVAQQVLTELSALLGHGSSHERLAHIEDVMRPMYTSLPKQQDGGIDQGVARYALNRYFSAHRGWHITGIAYDGKRWNASSSTAMLKSKMPSFIIELLEEHIASHRLGLGELAVLAATVEDLVRREAFEVLTMVYEAYNLSTHEPLENEAQEDLVIKTFTLFYTMPWTQETRKNSSAVRLHLESAHKYNPAWNDTLLWVEDLAGTLKYQNHAGQRRFSKGEAYFRSYLAMVHLVEHITDGYGLYQDIQCRELKNMMMGLETQERNDGRVLLANFYMPYRKGTHDFFVERPEYLQSLGALDESDPKRPSVIVPNFLYGRAFCVATDNAFQSFCCVDQCNVLMETLEQSVAHSVASPGLIAEVVAGLPSDTVAAPRNLSGSLRGKLDAIAKQHGGHVPLHGRLFAQWMHHAFPNECPQPREPGVTEAPMTHNEWRARQNTTSYVSKQVIQELLDLAAKTEGPACEDESCMLWADEEELITDIDLKALASPRAEWLHGQQNVVCFLAMCGAVAALISILLESVRSSASILRPQVSKAASFGTDGPPSRVHLI